MQSFAFHGVPLPFLYNLLILHVRHEIKANKKLTKTKSKKWRLLLFLGETIRLPPSGDTMHAIDLLVVWPPFVRSFEISLLQTNFRWFVEDPSSIFVLRWTGMSVIGLPFYSSVSLWGFPAYLCLKKAPYLLLT